MQSSPLPILYSFRRCPYAIRARMALDYTNIKVELREVSLQNKPQAMIDASPKATVPILVINENEVIDESLDIIMWALLQNDSKQWYFELTDMQQSKIKELIEYNDNEFKLQLDNYKYSSRNPELTLDQHRDKTLPFLQRLNELLCLVPDLGKLEIEGQSQSD